MSVNRPFMREIAKRAGYTVHKRSSHGPTQAWDWGPKHQMLGDQFPNEEAAWRDLESNMHAKMVEAEKMIAIANAIIRETG
jgi:hypothetical protein